MKNIAPLILLFYLLFIFGQPAECHTDSLKSNFVGIETGYLHYASLDEIFVPYVYGGSAPYFQIHNVIERRNSIRKFSASYSLVKQVPVNLKLISMFNVKGYDGGNYVLLGDIRFKSKNTSLICFQAENIWCLPYLNQSRHSVYAGFETELYASLNSTMSDPELISLMVNPAVMYRFKFSPVFFIDFENIVTLAGLNLRKPYSGAEAQLYDYYDFSYYANYAKHNTTLDFVPVYFRIHSELSVKWRVSRRLGLGLAYAFQYVSNSKPKLLETVVNRLFLCVNYKLY